MSEDIDKISLRLLLNTKRKKGHSRKDDLITIANDILLLKNKMGKLEDVSKQIGISTNMLNRFLSALKVDKSVQEYIKKREIDNINAVYYTFKLPSEDQKIIAKYLIDKRLNSVDIRAIAPIRKKHPKEDIQVIINRVKKSKPIKRYLVKFSYISINKLRLIKNELQKILNNDDYLIRREGEIVILDLSSTGINLLKNEAKKQKITFKQLMIFLIK